MFEAFNRYADFSGRSARTEYWLFQLLNFIVWMIAIGVLFSGLDFSLGLEEALAAAVGGASFIVGVTIIVFWLLVGLVPGLAVTVRRLHDRNMSGWWYPGLTLLGMLPFVGWVASIAFFVVLCLDGTAGENRFGEDPKGRGWGAASAVFA
jgi:uncharacterized membrane protein YhaH (DUF805 family)